ncbi:MAG: hypothetical protein ACRCX2_10515 [Paraclostridium sp.]
MKFYYLAGSLFFPVGEWHILYNVNSDFLVHIDRFTEEGVVSSGKFILKEWAFMCTLFGYQNVLDLVMAVATRYKSVNYTQLINFIGGRLKYER